VNSPKLVGITGGIGSGKSTVCKIFESLGAKTYYADDRAKQLMVENEQIIDHIKSIFGNESYLEDQLNKSYISKKAFESKHLLNQLNDVVHPAVRIDFEEWVNRNDEEKMLLKEAALLIETKSYKALDTLIVVVADEETRIARTLDRDNHRTEEEIRKIISEQLPDEEKVKYADFIISNNDHQSLITQVTKIYDELIIA
jgi:dephospho-CoA kinase